MIRRLLLILSLLFHVFSFLNAQDVKQHSVALIPYPVTLVEGEGAFVFSEKTVVALEDKDLEPVARDFVGLMSVAHQAILLYFALAVSSPTRPIFR